MLAAGRGFWCVAGAVALLGGTTLVLAISPYPRAAGANHPLVAFRYDDLSALSPTRLERDLLEAFARRGGAFTIGAIPSHCGGNVKEARPQPTIPLTPEKLSLLRDGHHRGIVEIGLHGYSHQTRDPCCAEMAGAPYEEQLWRIREGKRILERGTGVTVETFMPPWNRYDANTLRALEATGFVRISADAWGELRASRLEFIPVMYSLADVEAAVTEMRTDGDPAGAVVVILHPYDFVEYNAARGVISFPEFTSLLDRLMGLGARLVTIRDVDRMVDGSASAAESRRRSAEAARHASWMLPRFLRPAPRVAQDARPGVFRQLLLRIVTYYLFLVATGWLVGTALAGQRPLRFAAGVWVGLFATLATAAALAWHVRPSHGLAAPISILVGVLLGGWAAVAPARRAAAGATAD